MGSHRVKHDLVTKQQQSIFQTLSTSFSLKGQPAEPDFPHASVILFLSTPEAFANYHLECLKQAFFDEIHYLLISMMDCQKWALAGGMKGSQDTIMSIGLTVLEFLYSMKVFQNPVRHYCQVGLKQFEQLLSRFQRIFSCLIVTIHKK